MMSDKRTMIYDASRCIQSAVSTILKTLGINAAQNRKESMKSNEFSTKGGTQFRQWATKRLNEYIRKGFALDDERLKNGGGRYFRELLQRIRDIRTSERNLYQ
jgi:hypothetical protein